MKNKGVYFDNIHSYKDLNLILSPFTPTPAQPKTNYIEIPFGEGSLDLTEAHGEVKFNDREFVFTFTVNPSDEMTFDEKLTQVSNALNGRRCRITLDRDSDFYWDGRCIVDQYLQNKRIKQIVIRAIVKPYKMKQEETIVVVDLSSTEKKIILENSRKRVIPVITCTNDKTNVVFNGNVFKFSAGTHEVLEICLTEGENSMTVSGTGTITFTYHEGEL